jgi:Na+/H+ antiporter
VIAPPPASGELDLVLLGVLVGVGALLVLAYRTGLPYPILLVVGGAGIGFVPGVPDVALDPDVVLVIVLPPLLYAAAFFSSLRDLRANLRPISLLAVGLVVTTTVGVAAVAHATVDGMSWEAAFVLGAVVSPTDPVAASAIATRVSAPRRYLTIVEGESLVNDSTALIAYKAAVAATVSGGFSLWEAGATFLLNASAGIAIGLAVGWLITALRRRIDDAPTEISISLITPFLAYLPAEALGVSAVLAAVTAGIWLGWRSPQLITPDTRIRTFSVWELLVFVLNAALFTLVGLQLPAVVDGIRSTSVSDIAVASVAVAAAVVLLRFAWVFPGTFLPRALSVRVRERDPNPPWRDAFLVAWTGMRGAVSLAAALAIPRTIDGGGAFPQRDTIIFLTYVVIFATLVVQGLTLPMVIRWLGIEPDESTAQKEDKARLLAAQAAIQRIDELAGEEWVRDRSAERMRASYQFRIRRFSARFDGDDDGVIEEGSQAFQRLRHQALEAERQAIVRLRNEGRISDDIMHRIERDLDLEDTRLDA